MYTDAVEVLAKQICVGRLRVCISWSHLDAGAPSKRGQSTSAELSKAASLVDVLLFYASFFIFRDGCVKRPTPSLII